MGSKLFRWFGPPPDYKEADTDIDSAVSWSMPPAYNEGEYARLYTILNHLKIGESVCLAGGTFILRLL